MPINLISKIKPKNDGQFPVYEDRDVEGGYQVRTDLSDRNSIPELNRKEGMLVYVQSDGKYYTLSGGVADENWVEAQIGGGFTPDGDLSGTSINQTVIGLNTVPLPTSIPTDSDMLKAEEQILLSDYPLGSCTDGSNIWVADTRNPYNDDNYGGIVKVAYADEYISTRFDYPEVTSPFATAKHIYSVAYLDGYIYATGLEYVEGYVPIICKINPSDGTILEYTYTDDLAYAHVAGSTLWITTPMHATNQLYKVDPENISTQTLVWSEGSTAGYIGFTYDYDEDRIWASSMNDDAFVKINPNTSAIEFTNYDYDLPSGLEYGNGYIWLIAGVNTSYGYSSGYPNIYALEKTAGNISHSISDSQSILNNTVLISYDATNNKFWVPCNVNSSYRIIRIDADTFTVDGIAALESMQNVSIISAGGYVWVVDNPTVTGAFSILKIDPALVTDITGAVPVPPWDGLIASITSGPMQYNFIKKNSATTTQYDYTSSDIILQNKEEIVLVDTLAGAYTDVILPLYPVDGQKHTIINALSASPKGVRIYAMSGYLSELIYVFTDPYGAATLVWSEAKSSWYVISYFPVATPVAV